MEQKFGKNSIDIKALREFCEREGKEVTYRKGDQLEREGDPARWFGFVTEGCFKYVTYGITHHLVLVRVHSGTDPSVFVMGAAMQLKRMGYHMTKMN